VATWMVPNGMTSHVHMFEAREGGSFRISLTYNEPTGTGKTTAHTDTYHGRFISLVPNRRVVQVVEFETRDPDLQGEMTITMTLAESHGATEIVAIHDSLPPGLSADDNEAGWRSALAKLATLVTIASHDGPLARRAHVALPATTWAETEGTYVNSRGMAQKSERAIDPRGSSRPAWDLVAQLGQALGYTLPWKKLKDVRRAMEPEGVGAAVPAGT